MPKQPPPLHMTPYDHMYVAPETVRVQIPVDTETIMNLNDQAEKSDNAYVVVEFTVQDLYALWSGMNDGSGAPPTFAADTVTMTDFEPRDANLVFNDPTERDIR